MDADQAREQVHEAREAYLSASRPRLPVPVVLISALFAGVGVALVAQPSDDGLHRALFVVGGILLLAAAWLIPVYVRRRHGLYGFRGAAERDHTVFFLCILAVVLAGLDTSRTLGTIYVGIGVVTGVAWGLVLSRRLGGRA